MHLGHQGTHGIHQITTTLFAYILQGVCYFKDRESRSQLYIAKDAQNCDVSLKRSGCRMFARNMCVVEFEHAMVL